MEQTHLIRGGVRKLYPLEVLLDVVGCAHFGGSTTKGRTRPANRRVGRMPQGNIVPHFAGLAFLPGKEGGLEGRDFVE